VTSDHTHALFFFSPRSVVIPAKAGICCLRTASFKNAPAKSGGQESDPNIRGDDNALKEIQSSTPPCFWEGLGWVLEDVKREA
jgi:hypothetical protein